MYHQQNSTHIENHQTAESYLLVHMQVGVKCKVKKLHPVVQKPSCLLTHINFRYILTNG